MSLPSPDQQKSFFEQLQRGNVSWESKPNYRNFKPARDANAWSVLKEIRAERAVWDIEGRKKETGEFVTLQEGEELHRVMMGLKPRLTIEIGLMHAYSALCMLQALSDLGGGRLLSIDPGQFGDYAGGIGLMNIRRANLHPFHLFWSEYSQFALPVLCKEGGQVDFSFIDGNHLLDYTMLEFFYLDKMTAPGGIIAFHDYVNPSVFTVLQYIESNFAYRAEPCECANLRILRKLKNDERPWYYFVPFQAATTSWLTLENRKQVDPAGYLKPPGSPV